MNTRYKIYDAFFGGINRDDQSNLPGVMSSLEEVDIFSNKNYIQAEQVMTADTLPTATEVYAYTVDDDDNVWAYGKNTADSKARLLKVTTGGVTNPGDFATVFTSTNASNAISQVIYHKTSETNGKFIYYITGTGDLRRYDVVAGTEASVGTLTGLTGTNDRPTMKRFYGELYICNGMYIAHVDDDGIFTDKKFTLPNSTRAIDILPVSDVAIILTQSTNQNINETVGYWWDLLASTQFDDQFKIQMGGGQWIASYREKVIICCASNGVMRFYQLSVSAPGAQVLELPGKVLYNCGIETSTQPVSPTKSVGTKDGLLYFGVFKTDKSGIYAMGQVDSSAPLALVLSKRFLSTDNYAQSKPTALVIHGPNFYCAYLANTTASVSRCESNNSPSRSSSAVVETVWDSKTGQRQKLTSAYLLSYKLPASTALDLYIATDYDSTYTQVKRADSSIFNTANGLMGLFRPAAFDNKYSFKTKVLFTSNGTSSPKLQSIIQKYSILELE